MNEIWGLLSATEESAYILEKAQMEAIGEAAPRKELD